MFKSHTARGFWLCLAVTFLVIIVYLFNGFRTLELRAVDWSFHWRGGRAVNPDIVVVTIDEESIDRLGRWPWPRAVHARLVRGLSKAGAKAVAFDSLFTEVDAENPASDRTFAHAAKETGNVVSAFFYKGGINGIEGLDPLVPYDALDEASRAGFVNLQPDKDGVTRRAALFVLERVSDEEVAIRPSFAVSALALSQGKTFEELMPSLPAALNKQDPFASDSLLFVNYAFDREKPFGCAYPFYSYADVLEGKIPPETFDGKIVLVGATAAALYDLKAVPFIEIYPGVMIHANIIDNLISGEHLREATLGQSSLAVLLVGLLFGFVLPRLGTWVKLGAFAAVVAGVIALALWLFSAQNFVLHYIPVLANAGGCYGGVLFYGLLIEEREKRKIKGSFKQYLSPKIIDVITRDPAKLKLGGEEREVSIFFLDIAGFTTMSEALAPTQLVEVMNECLTEFSRIVMKHDGLINKYIGDCIMAFWNAPVDQPRHASLACLAALDCIAALPGLNQRFQAKGLPAIDCRVGVNTGTVVVGNMGSNERFDYTVMGDPVNLASRLEGANKEYHTHIMVSDVTFEKARADIEARDLDLIRVKGKKEPRKVFEVLCKKGEMSETLSQGRDLYHQGLSLYRQRQFSEAIDAFQQVFQFLPDDHLTRVYLERARTFQISPPPATWDGVFKMTTK